MRGAPALAVPLVDVRSVDRLAAEFPIGAGADRGLRPGCLSPDRGVTHDAAVDFARHRLLDALRHLIRRPVRSARGLRRRVPRARRSRDRCRSCRATHGIPPASTAWLATAYTARRSPSRCTAIFSALRSTSTADKVMPSMVGVPTCSAGRSERGGRTADEGSLAMAGWEVKRSLALADAHGCRVQPVPIVHPALPASIGRVRRCAAQGLADGRNAQPLHDLQLLLGALNEDVQGVCVQFCTARSPTHAKPASRPVCR